MKNILTALLLSAVLGLSGCASAPEPAAESDQTEEQQEAQQETQQEEERAG